MFRFKQVVAAAVAGLFVTAAWAVAQDNAVIKGKALFKGTAPRREVLDTSKDPNCKKNKAKIGDYQVIVNKTDPPTLRNVLVSVKEGLGDRTFKAPDKPVTITQVGCEYEPHILALMEGQALKVLNGDETNHNIHFLPKKNEEHNFSQPKPDAVGKELKLVAEDLPIKVKCDVHPWMGAWVGVFKHPFFAITGEDGMFTIANLPPGKYTITAWHETYGEQTAEVEVASGATAEKDFTFEAK